MGLEAGGIDEPNLKIGSFKIGGQQSVDLVKEVSVGGGAAEKSIEQAKERNEPENSGDLL